MAFISGVAAETANFLRGSRDRGRGRPDREAEAQLQEGCGQAKVAQIPGLKEETGAPARAAHGADEDFQGALRLLRVAGIVKWRGGRMSGRREDFSLPAAGKLS